MFTYKKVPQVISMIWEPLNNFFLYPFYCKHLHTSQLLYLILSFITYSLYLYLKSLPHHGFLQSSCLYPISHSDPLGSWTSHYQKLFHPTLATTPFFSLQIFVSILCHFLLWYLPFFYCLVKAEKQCCHFCTRTHIHRHISEILWVWFQTTAIK